MNRLYNNDQGTVRQNIDIAGVGKYAINDYGASWATSATIAADLLILFPDPVNGDIAVLRNTNGTDEDRIYLYTAGAWRAFTSASIADGSIGDAKIASNAGIALSKLAAVTGGYVVLGNASNVATATQVTGDVLISNAGVTSFNGAVIVNADVNAGAAIEYSKLAGMTSANILIGSAGNVATVTPVTGDVSITNTGLTTVTDLTITGEAHGDILYRNATNWVRLAAGTPGEALVTAGVGSNPYWGTPSVGLASSLESSVTIDGGANDITLVTTAQTVGGINLTIPDYANVDQTLCTLNLAQTFTEAQTFPNEGIHILDTNGSHDLILKAGSDLTADRLLTFTTGDAARTITLAGNVTTANDLITAGNFSLTLTTTGATDVTLPTTGTLATLAGTETLAGKTLTTPKIVTTGSICDAGGDEYIVFTEATTPVTYIGITSGDTGVAPQVRGAGEANTGLLLAGTGTGNVTLGDGADITKLLSFELSGATTAKTMTFTCSHTDDRVLTFPDATDTLVGKATTDVFTNKSFDCDGTGNVLTNVNANELDPITIAASAQYGIPFVIPYVLTNQAAAVNIYNANSPIKFQIIKAWSIATSADGGTWKLNNGAAGGGTDITNAVTVAANDQDFDEPTDYDNSAWQIAANGSLSIVPDGAGLLDCEIYIMCLRID